MKKKIIVYFDFRLDFECFFGREEKAKTSGGKVKAKTEKS